MEKKFYLVLLAFLLSIGLKAQNKPISTIYGEKITIDARMGTAERNALPLKTVGMMIFNTDTKCHEFWDGIGWYNYCWRGYAPTYPSTGGTGVVSGYVCDTASAGAMIVGIPVTAQVKQTITATVTTVGTYNISTVANGVTFSKSGTFAATGAQTIILDAAGTPAAPGSHSFALNTTPSCSFSRTTAPVQITAIDCTGTNAGILLSGQTPSSGSVTTTVSVTANAAGTFTIETNTVNGVQFSKTETFTSAGIRIVTLVAIGRPTAPGTSVTFTIQGDGGGCTFTRIITGAIGDGTVVTPTGRMWMDRNLGALQVATSSDDHLAYGSLFQWGRRADDHEQITWHSSTSGTPLNAITTTLANNDNPYPFGNGLYIHETPGILGDWRSPQNDNLWQGVSGINNPCPLEYRIPTASEWEAEISAPGARITNAATAIAHVLKLPVPGYRTSGNLIQNGTYGHYHSSDIDANTLNTRNYTFKSNHSGMNYSQRDHSLSVRCIKD